MLFHRLANFRAAATAAAGGVPGGFREAQHDAGQRYLAPVPGFLSAMDEAIKSKFVNMESRYLYAAYGPDVLANCSFCSTDDSRSFLFYSLPALLFPHLLNLVVIGLATSPLLSSAKETSAPPKYPGDNTASRACKAASQWRQSGTVAAVGLATLDVFLFWSLDPFTNKNAKRLADVEWFYWRYRALRFFSLAMLDLLGAILVWLSGTNRAFIVGGPTTAERIANVLRGLHTVRGKMSAAGSVKNTAARDAELRKRGDAYWNREVAVMGEVMQEREVVDGVNDALVSRLNLTNIQRDADAYVEELFRPLLAHEATAMRSPSSPSSSSSSSAVESATITTGFSPAASAPHHQHQK